FAETNYEALVGADALVVVTDWNEYRHPDFERVKRTLRQPVIVDGRNLYDVEKMRELGVRYHSIGRHPHEPARSQRVKSSGCSSRNHYCWRCCLRHRWLASPLSMRKIRS